MRMKARLNQILANHTGQPIEKIDKDTDRDYILQAQDAVEYGIVDQVIAKRD
jgi:ATP-dependent Clp protease protease subunit